MGVFQVVFSATNREELAVFVLKIGHELAQSLYTFQRTSIVDTGADSSDRAVAFQGLQSHFSCFLNEC